MKTDHSIKLRYIIRIGRVVCENLMKNRFRFELSSSLFCSRSVYLIPGAQWFSCTHWVLQPSRYLSRSCSPNLCKPIGNYVTLQHFFLLFFDFFLTHQLLSVVPVLDLFLRLSRHAPAIATFALRNILVYFCR